MITIYYLLDLLIDDLTSCEVYNLERGRNVFSGFADDLKYSKFAYSIVASIQINDDYLIINI